MKLKYTFHLLWLGILFSSAIYAQNTNKDLVYLNSGEIVSGTLVEIAYPRHVRLMVEDQYLEPFLFKDIDKIIQNQMYDEPFDVLYMVSGERTIGIILQIKPNDFITFIPDHLGDTVYVSHEKVKRVFHKKENIERKLNALYKGDHHYFSISPGLGLTHGGLGIRLQYRFGGDFGVGIHVGGGITANIFFGADPFYNMGLKFFFLNHFFIDGSYGVTGTYYKKAPYYSDYKEVAVNTTGYALQLGTDYFFNKYFGVNVGFGLVIPSKEQVIASKYIFDTGVIIKFPIRKHRNQSKKK